MRKIRMAEPIDLAYIMAESAIEDNDYDHFKAILEEYPNLDIYNGPIRTNGSLESWSQPLLGIAIDSENIQIVDIILALKDYNVRKSLKYEEFGRGMTALEYAEHKRAELVQESGSSNPGYMNDIQHIIAELHKKTHNQTGGKRRRSHKSRKSRGSRNTTSRRRRH